jgi:hypothetical protein
VLPDDPLAALNILYRATGLQPMHSDDGRMMNFVRDRTRLAVVADIASSAGVVSNDDYYDFYLQRPSAQFILGPMADDTHDDSIQYENDPENCAHSRVSVRESGAIPDGEIDPVTSNWGTCQDCGKRVPNPVPGVGGSTGAVDDRP